MIQIHGVSAIVSWYRVSYIEVCTIPLSSFGVVLDFARFKVDALENFRGYMISQQAEDPWELYDFRFNLIYKALVSNLRL